MGRTVGVSIGQYGAVWVRMDGYGSVWGIRVKKILEQLSRTRFLTAFEFRALFFGAT